MESLLQKITEYRYALLYMYSEVILCKVDELDSIDWEQCTEARFFDETREMHVVFEDNKSIEHISKDADYKDSLIRKYRLASRFAAMGKSLIVKQYLGQDEDGQYCVVKTRLAGIE